MSFGITEDLITRLQRFRTFPVISHNSTRRFDPDEHDLRDVARDLGVTYLITGSMRNLGGEQVRLTVELAQAPSLEVVWRDDFDCPAADIASSSNDVTLAIAAHLEPEIERAERSQDLPDKTESLASWHLVRRGLWHQYKLTRLDAEKALDYFREALDLDPDSVEALIQMGWWHWWDLSAKRATASDWQIIERYGRKAVVLDPRDPRAVELIGVAILMKGEPHAARPYLLKAIAMNPSYAWGYNSLGSAHWLAGAPDLAIEAITKALSFSPYDLYVFHALADMGIAYYMLGEYQQRSIMRNGPWRSAAATGWG